MRVIARARQQRGPDVGRTPGASYANLCHEVRPAAAAVQCGLQQLGLLRPGQRVTRRRPGRTPVGQEALDAWRHSYLAVKDGAGEAPDLALAVAIWGLRTLWNTRLRDITEAISPTTYGTD
ncbi:MAG TPA: hypothetical protein VGA04_06355 [Streptosporangiaceae bacterium]